MRRPPAPPNKVTLELTTPGVEISLTVSTVDDTIEDLLLALIQNVGVEAERLILAFERARSQDEGT